MDFRLYQLHEVATLATLTEFMQLHSQGSTNFPKNLEGPFQILGTQRDVTKQVPYSGPKIPDRSVNVIVGWRFLLAASELTHISVRKEKNCSNYTEIFGTIIWNSVVWVS